MKIGDFLRDICLLIIEQVRRVTRPAVPRIAAQGKVAGQEVDTTVDSDLAKYYLEDYWSGKNQQVELDQIINQVEAEYQESLPDRESLMNLANKYSVDFATLFLTKQLLNIPQNGKIHSCFLAAFKQAKEDVQSGKIPQIPHITSFVFLIVPAWDYVKTGAELGTDFLDTRKMLDQFGAENHLLEIDPIGSVEKNAKIVASEILRFSRESKKAIIIVSASSSGPSVAHALGEILESCQLSQVKGWLNVTGILQGAVFLDFFLKRPMRWLFHFILKIKKWDLVTVESFSAAVRRQCFQNVCIPENIFILNYLSIPLSGNISNFARLNYKLIRKQGPNDGSALILDAIAPNGVSVVSFGTDHFINFDPEISLKVVAIVQTVVKHLSKTV